MKTKTEQEQIVDYGWLSKTQRSWHIQIGNPFCISNFRIPLSAMTKDEVIQRMKKSNKNEKKRFTKLFPDMEWKVMEVKTDD